VPGQHGQARRPKIQGYGLQLREKQKVKRTYGLLERQFRAFYHKAEKAKGPTGENLIVMLERRLDNAVWRAGLASSRSQARQLVLHGHIQVNGSKVNIPSYLIAVGQEIVAEREDAPEHHGARGPQRGPEPERIVTWLDIDRENCKARVVALPKRENVTDAAIQRTADRRVVLEVRTGISIRSVSPANGEEGQTTCGRVFKSQSDWRRSWIR
jgi:small subunit ribosomal protein S4